MPCQVTGTTIVLSGDVGDMGWYWDESDCGFTAADVISALAQIGDGKDVTVRLNSGGGIATEGSAIHAALTRHQGRKTVIVEGVAASAASVVAMAGDEVVMSLGAIMMVHDPAALTMGTVADHEGTIAGLTALGDAMAAVYAAKSGQSVEACRADMKAETWMTPDQAVAKGYADRVEGAADTGAEPAEPAAFPYTAYHHAPSRMVALARAKHWDRTRKPTAQAVPTPITEKAPMATEEEIRARIDAAVTAEREKHNAQGPAPTGTAEPAAASTGRADAAEIAEICVGGGAPAMAASLIREGVTAAVARERVNMAGQIRDVVALARKNAPHLAADLADKAIGSGKTIATVKSELFDAIAAADEKLVVDPHHRAGAGGANHSAGGGDGVAKSKANMKALVEAQFGKKGN